jgi:biopolymer transport protein TolR
MNLNSGGSARRGRRGARRAPMAEINVTPFVDVMLVLLIIFMVTAPLLVSGVPVELPESSAKPLDQKAEPIDISIDKEGQVFLDSEPVSDATVCQLPCSLRSSSTNTAAQKSATTTLGQPCPFVLGPSRVI